MIWSTWYGSSWYMASIKLYESPIFYIQSNPAVVLAPAQNPVYISYPIFFWQWNWVQTHILVFSAIYRSGFWKKSYLIQRGSVCLSVCVSVCMHAGNFWKHLHPCLWCSMVNMEGCFRLFLEFFKNSNFWVFGGHFKVKICPKFEIFT